MPNIIINLFKKMFYRGEKPDTFEFPMPKRITVDRTRADLLLEGHKQKLLCKTKIRNKIARASRKINRGK